MCFRRFRILPFSNIVQKECTIINPFLCILGNSRTFDVLDAFTYCNETLLLSGVVSFVPYIIANQPHLAHSGSYGLLGQIVINHESH